MTYESRIGLFTLVTPSWIFEREEASYCETRMNVYEQTDRTEMDTTQVLLATLLLHFCGTLVKNFVPEYNNVCVVNPVK